MNYWLNVVENIFDYILPKLDQKSIDDRIRNFIQNLIAAFKQRTQENAAQWKVIYKTIDDASQGEDNRWFRTLIADIDSNAVSTAANTSLTETLKKLDDASKLVISNIQKLSKRINTRRENIRERVKNFIRHLPKVFMNETNFELLFPVGFQPLSDTKAIEIAKGIARIIRNPYQGLDTNQIIIKTYIQSRSETYRNYIRAFRSLAKRLLKRNPSLTPEFNAIIANTGDAIDLHGHYVYLNPSCDYVLAHDFDGLRFSFRFIYGKIYSVLPNLVEIKENECSNTGRIQICNRGHYSILRVPMYYGEFLRIKILFSLFIVY